MIRPRPLAVLPFLLAAVPSAQELALRPERVVVFKDGTALVVKRATATTDADGVVYTEEVPDAAALGCFWAAVEAEGPGAPRVATMRAEHVERVVEGDPEVAVRSMRELLEANAGREVRLQPVDPGAALIQGRILEVLGDAGLCVLRVDGAATLAVPIADVRSVLADELATRRSADARTVRTKRLSIELRRDDGPHAGAEVALRLCYFTPGLRWIPTYRLEGDLESSGALALTAEVLNELEDLDGTELDLVVGVPSFRFGREISPLSLEAAMRDALLSAAPGLQANAFSNALFGQHALDPGALPSTPWAPDEPAPGAGVARELGATGEQDLYVHHAGRIDLPKGARATLALWTETVPIEHLYTYDLAIVRGTDRNARALASARVDASLPPAPTPVRHELRLKNLTPHPWTTGPVLLLRGLLPLGQDLLTYTPAGAETLLPAAVAVDVRGAFEEEQIARKEKAEQRNGATYDLIEKRVRVELANHRPEPVRARVRVALGGDVTAVSEPATVVRGEPRASDWSGDGRFDHALNPHTDVELELDLAAGETRAITLDVRLYAR